MIAPVAWPADEPATRPLPDSVAEAVLVPAVDPEIESSNTATMSAVVVEDPAAEAERIPRPIRPDSAVADPAEGPEG